MEHSYRSRDILRLADSERFPQRVRGFTRLDSNAVVKFPCGFAVAVHHGRGTLAALWPLGRPKRLPAKMEHQGKLVPVQAPPELGEEFFQRPNFSVADGVHVRYGLEGDLRWIVNVRQGALNGLCLRFEPEGLLRPQDSGIFKEGVLTERWQESLLPDGFIGYVLSEIVLPMKKALQLALSPCEQRLCYEHHVDVDAVRPKELNQYPPGQGAETLEEVDVAAGGRSPREWWRPQVKIVDPSKVYDNFKERPFHFAPIGPSRRSPVEVTPFVSSRANQTAAFSGYQPAMAPVFQEEVDEDADLKDIFGLGAKKGPAELAACGKFLWAGPLGWPLDGRPTKTL
ncbi:unnamed protein product [Durusdinium trenchii]|uniref:Uncharacterized protein n=1 Tax=Durusdinium trenchii TaxID=1381693 RepID=A0ABP0NNW1_9DINO